ncbi:MAG: hypothetical protein K2G32_09290, partial [Oscillospiraceae bacterium]|nr:hypothetical protein [Oscillospiraceae bacterium]
HNCGKLERVEIPASVKEFETVRIGLNRDTPLEVFDTWAARLVIYVERGSNAEKYCKEKRFRYKYMEDI